MDSYALSLERINPFPPDAQPITLSKVVDGVIAAATEQNVFTFYGATTGTYQVSITYASGPAQACMYLYYPDTISPKKSGCTSGNTYQFQFKPPEDDTYMLLVNGAGNDQTVSYNLEVSCLVGMCKTVYPPCTLTDIAAYDSTSETLTMNFTVGNNVATTWNAWLTYQNTMVSLFSVSQPITVPPKKITKTKTGLPKKGKVGVLSTLTTPTKGIFCSSWVQIATGKP